MKTLKHTLATVLVGSMLFAAASLHAGDTKSYQVTGPVLEVTPTKIVVKKGEDRWEIARTSDTKITGDLKVGAKVTIYYTMSATAVEVKTDKK